jgi:hypothetical protein
VQKQEEQEQEGRKEGLREEIRSSDGWRNETCDARDEEIDGECRG